MKCPHDKELTAQEQYGVTLYLHPDGGRCSLMNRLDTSCRELAAANSRRALRGGAFDRHMLRNVYSSYKISADVRFLYLQQICELEGEDFLNAFEPVRLALASEDDFAAGGLYLMELYFCFCGVTSRISAANTELPETPLYQLLGSLGAARVMPQENETTREYARRLHTRYLHWQKSLHLPNYTLMRGK